jgi:hypothetical protein
MNLSYGQAPLTELPKRTSILTVASQIVERVFGFGEDEQRHPRVFEDLLLVQHLPKLLQFRLDFAFPSARAWRTSMSRC